MQGVCFETLAGFCVNFCGHHQQIETTVGTKWRQKKVSKVTKKYVSSLEISEKVNLKQKKWQRRRDVRKLSIVNQVDRQ